MVPGPTGTTAAFTWSTDTAATSKISYGTDPAVSTQSLETATLVTSHGLVLSSLSPSTTYHYRITSVLGGQAATYPVGNPGTFTTPLPGYVDTTKADFGAGTPDANARSPFAATARSA